MKPNNTTRAVVEAEEASTSEEAAVQTFLDHVTGRACDRDADQDRDRRGGVHMIRITCFSNDTLESGRRTLAKFEDGNTVFDQQKAKSKALYWLDDMLDAVKGFSLFAALNDIQAECNLDKEHPLFPNKTEMPLCILNLVLKEHGLELEED